MDSLSNIVLVVALGFVAVAVFILTKNFFHQEETLSAKQLLGEEDKNRKASNVIVRYSRAVYSRYLVPIVQGLKIDPIRKKYKQQIIAAGMTDEFTPDELYAFKLFLIIGFPVALSVANYFGDFGMSYWIMPLTGVIGYYYPDLMLRSGRLARQLEVRKSMPFIVDLLALSTEAGLDFIGAIAKVVDKAKPSPLVQEFEQVLKEIKVGSSRSDALKEMSKRIDMPEISSFTAILISADAMGASIGKVLRQQSDQIRTQRFLAGEKEGAKASQKIMVPMFLFILPAIILMIFGPFAIMMFKGGFSV